MKYKAIIIVLLIFLGLLSWVYFKDDKDKGYYYPNDVIVVDGISLVVQPYRSTVGSTVGLEVKITNNSDSLRAIGASQFTFTRDDGEIKPVSVDTYYPEFPPTYENRQLAPNETFTGWLSYEGVDSSVYWLQFNANDNDAVVIKI